MGVQNSEQMILQAAKKGDLVAAKQAILSGVNLEVSDDNGKTPLLRAAKYGSVEVVKLLLQHQANIAAVARDGRNVLHFAAAAGHDNVIQALFSFGAADLIDETDNEGRKPSDVCSKKNKAKVLDLLHEAALDKKQSALFQLDMNAKALRQSFDMGSGRRTSLQLSAIREERDSMESKASSRGSMQLNVSASDGRRRSMSDLAFQGRRAKPALPSNLVSVQDNSAAPGYVDPRTFQPISSSLRSSRASLEHSSGRASFDKRAGPRPSGEFSRNPRPSGEFSRNRTSKDFGRTSQEFSHAGKPSGRKSVSEFSKDEQSTYQRRAVQWS